MRPLENHTIVDTNETIEKNTTTKKSEEINNLKQSKVVEIQKNKPTPDEFLSELKIKNPDMYNKLTQKILEDKDILEPDLTKEEYIKQYLHENIEPLYLSNEQENNNNFIDANGMKLQVNYETGFNYALTDEGNIVHYSEMGSNPNYPDVKFLGYGIFWKTDKK